MSETFKFQIPGHFRVCMDTVEYPHTTTPSMANFHRSLEIMCITNW